MSSTNQPFHVPQTADEIRDLARRYASEGIGEDEHAFELWFKSASAEDLETFSSEVNAVCHLSLALAENHSTPKIDLNGITKPDQKKGFPPGFDYLAHDAGEWKDLPVKGARLKECSNHPADGFSVMILEMDAGARFPSHHHKGAEQVYLLEGDIVSDGQTLSPGDFLRAAADTHHSGLYSETGCRALIITARNNYPSKAIGAYNKISKGIKKILGRT